MLAPLYFEVHLFDNLVNWLFNEQSENNSQQFQEMHLRNDYISLNLRQKGQSIKISEQVKNNFRYYTITGQGRVFADTQLLQDKTYFEIHVTSNLGKESSLEVGLIREIGESDLDISLNVENEEENSFVTVFGNKFDQIHASEGTIIGVAFDQSDVHPQMIIYKDGIMVETKVGMRGKLTPCLGLFPEGGEQIKVNVVFEQDLFSQNMPSGFNAILKSVDIF